MNTQYSNKQNVLFIVPSLNRAGAETQLVDLVNDIDSTRFNKTLVVFDKNIDQLIRLDKNSVDFYHIARSSKYDFSIFRKIAKLIDKKEINIIHCTLQISMLVAQIAVFFANKKPKVLVSIHTTVNFTKKNELADKLLYRYLMKRCERIIFVCKNQARYWGKRFPELKRSSVVIYNGINTDFFDKKDYITQGASLRQNLDIPDTAPIITCIAGFRKEKGHQYLIEAFEKLTQRAYLLLVGEGITRPFIESLVREKNIGSWVRFLGELSDVRPVLAETDVTVLASTSETFSMVMLESMSMAVPMIATDTGGMSEAIISGETGDLVLPLDSTSLAKALLPYVANREYAAKVGLRARAMVVKKFSKKLMVQETEKVLAEAID